MIWVGRPAGRSVNFSRYPINMRTPKFTIRDILFAFLVTAILLGWMIDHNQLNSKLARQIETTDQQVEAAVEREELVGGSIESALGSTLMLKAVRQTDPNERRFQIKLQLVDRLFNLWRSERVENNSSGIMSLSDLILSFLEVQNAEQFKVLINDPRFGGYANRFVDADGELRSEFRSFLSRVIEYRTDQIEKENNLK